MSKPLVSVIVPVYNGATYLNKTVDAILSQSYENLELVLINDGSIDESKELINLMADSDPRVIALHCANGGVAAARNVGIKNSSGELIAFCDQDDLWLTEKLEKQVPLFAEPQIGLVYCGSFAHYTDLNKTVNPDFSRNKKGWVFDSLVQENMLTCCTAVVRREALSKIGGFDPDRALMGVDDWHLWLKVALVAKFEFVAEPLAIHVFHGDNYSLNDKKMHAAELVCLDKIEALADRYNKSADWSLITQTLHTRYASSYVFSGFYQLAGETYLKAHSVLSNRKLWFKGWLFKLIPNCVWNFMQQTKRKINS
ncbi:hypothetical protein AHAT_06600 [Agarivorans sp. Toyoura001]|uniref:glycosyltransferase family 2 protein n=1 Tax=Agarivorans sp. Toyoura001 TaxID=2283141 RepID=UPI0010F21E70|nr:glycosyltransferase family A protein [Agarivorans sp. Toyoura001]GDY24770.1 hypothetical protein AHAT_06600 [Agarivorans sp. Toyoura001]